MEGPFVIDAIGLPRYTRQEGGETLLINRREDRTKDEHNLGHLAAYCHYMASQSHVLQLSRLRHIPYHLKAKNSDDESGGFVPLDLRTKGIILQDIAISLVDTGSKIGRLLLSPVFILPSTPIC